MDEQRLDKLTKEKAEAAIVEFLWHHATEKQRERIRAVMVPIAHEQLLRFTLVNE